MNQYGLRFFMEWLAHYHTARKSGQGYRAAQAYASSMIADSWLRRA